MNKNIKLLSLLTFVASAAMAQADQTTINGQTLSEKLEKEVGVEQVTGKNTDGTACVVSFIPGCGFSSLTITDGASVLQASYSMIEKVTVKLLDKSFVYNLNFSEGDEGQIGLFNYSSTKVGVVLRVNGKTKSCYIQK